MKITHEGLVNTYKNIGFEEVDIFPSVKVSLMFNGRERVMIIGSDVYYENQIACLTGDTFEIAEQLKRSKRD